MLRLARAEQNLGRGDAAQEVIEALVRAAPGVEVDRALYPASFAAAVESARAAVAGAPRLSLSVAASLDGAHVYVDGREVGIAPVEVTLSTGRHEVSGAKDALRVGPLSVNVDGEGSASRSTSRSRRRSDRTAAPASRSRRRTGPGGSSGPARTCASTRSSRRASRRRRARPTPWPRSTT